MIGLFDRPAQADWMGALRAEPVINGLTEAVADLDGETWRAAIARLRAVKLLDPEDLSPDALDAHPLVREWFGERLKEKNEDAWREAHSRLYEHLRDTTKEGETPTLGDLAPLYQAISHGCRARRYRELLNEILISRICRWKDGRLEYYSRRMLGATGSDVVAMSWFFQQPYEEPVAVLEHTERSWLLSSAALRLRGQGRLSEALPAELAGLRMDEAVESWSDASRSATNVSDVQLLLGQVVPAIASAAKSVDHADRSTDLFVKMIARTKHARALHAIGQVAEAELLFADAERREREIPATHSLIQFGVMSIAICCSLEAIGPLS